MSWTEALPTRRTRPTRPSLPRYLPPPFRNKNTSTESHSSVYRVPPSRGGSASGRGRDWGGRSWSPPREVKTPTLNPFDVFEKFDELEVTEEIEAGPGGGPPVAPPNRVQTLNPNLNPSDAIEKESGNGGINFDAYEDIPVEVSGLDIPAPVNSFLEIDLGRALNDNIKRCKYVKPTPIQRHAIPVAMAGRDLMACAQTGSGKTAAFCFPVISGILKQNLGGVNGGQQKVASPRALILSPTRELSCQIHEEAKKFSYLTGIKVVVAYGGAPFYQQLRDLQKGVDILVATAGRLVDMIDREKVSLKRIKYLALDEADRMLDMGFERQIRKIVEQMEMPPPGARQTLLFSATFPTEIQRLASDFLSNYIFLAVGRVGSCTDLIVQKVQLVQDMEKRDCLMNILNDQRASSNNGKRGADSLELWLCKNGFPATAIHGDKVQFEREHALRSFKTGKTPILVATDVASRGLDVPNVTHVINYDLPRDIDNYVHRIGRTGRAGKAGLATAFFSDNNSPLAKALVELMQEGKQEVPSWLTEYAENSTPHGSGRAYHNGGSKFDGHDFRNDPNSSADQIAFDEPKPETYVAASGDFTCADPAVNDFSASSANSFSSAGAYGYGFVNGTGWE